MRERVAAHGGELTIKVDPNGGMLLRAWMPLAQHFDELAHA
jgi:signal transduction histidine kinase